MTRPTDVLLPRDEGEPDRIPDPRFDLPEWHLRAACRGMDSKYFFMEVGESRSTAKKAKTVCAGCAVREECLDWAVTNVERWGVWGGMSERERRVVRKEKGAA